MKGIMKKLDGLFVEGVREYLEGKGLEEVRFEDLRREWGKSKIESIVKFNELYVEKNRSWNVYNFNDRFENWVNRNGLCRDRVIEGRKYKKKYVGFNN